MKHLVILSLDNGYFLFIFFLQKHYLLLFRMTDLLPLYVQEQRQLYLINFIILGTIKLIKHQYSLFNKLFLIKSVVLFYSIDMIV